jgi:hypothetical protein
LYRVVCDLCDLRVYAIIADLWCVSLRTRTCARPQNTGGEKWRALTWSSTKRSGPRPAERSLWMPACLPRRRWAILVHVSHTSVFRGLDNDGCVLRLSCLGVLVGRVRSSADVICRVQARGQRIARMLSDVHMVYQFLHWCWTGKNKWDIYTEHASTYYSPQT